MVADSCIYPFTAKVRPGGSALGLNPKETREVILSLRVSDFVKSMTSYVDNRIWQDVYQGVTKDGQAVYIKLTGYTDGRPPVISFKQK